MPRPGRLSDYVTVVSDSYEPGSYLGKRRHRHSVPAIALRPFQGSALNYCHCFYRIYLFIMAAASNPLRLASPDDYDDWITYIRLQAMEEDIWQYIDPN